MKALRGDRLLALLALCGAALFLPSLPRLWPLRPVPIPDTPPRQREAAVRRFLLTEAIPLERGQLTETAVAAYPSPYARESLETVLGVARARALLDNPRYSVAFRSPDGSGGAVQVTESGAIWSWQVPRSPEPVPPVSSERAEVLAQRALAETASDTDTPWRVVWMTRRNRRLPAVNRAQPEFPEWMVALERPLPEKPLLQDRFTVTIEGDQVIQAERFILTDYRRPPPRAPISHQALDWIGQAIFGTFVLAACLVFFLRLRDGSARLSAPARCAGVVFVATLTASLLIALPGTLVERTFAVVRDNLWTLLALLAVLSAGDALDRGHRDNPSQRGAALWELLRGRVFAPEVARSALRGLALAFLCAGVLSLTVQLLLRFGGGAVTLQPRGSFFESLLRARFSPLAILLYFLHVALLEEVGYRFFAGTWLLRLTGRPWVAVLLPAAVYGLTHTQVDFLPPAEPFWGRPLTMTLVGCVWGIAFLRYGALTVILSHWLSDLFLFTWPRLASGHPGEIAVGLLTLTVPVLPALGLLVRRPGYNPDRGQADEEDRSAVRPGEYVSGGAGGAD